MGKNKEFQIRAGVEINSNGDHELFANVWNWDPAWKVEWQMDGVNKGLLPRISDYDPLAVTLYKGDQLPESRTFVEPHKTDHLFKAIVAASAREIRITATDRFGDKYETIV